jgi:DNA (cytosine-5)-methyltransferase 1
MEFPRKVLDYYWPNADSHIDICKTDFKKYANKIDILTGGWPCQPFSHAGKRKGTKDERFLWHEMLRAIQEIKPKFVIGENVLGITNIDGGLVFEKVCVDLETEGYEVQPFIIPACAKNAPHRRDRCWFIGVRNATNTDCNGFQQCNGNDEINASERGINAFGNISESHGNGDVANPNFGEPKQPTFNCRMGRFGKQHEKDSWKFFPTESPICGGDDGIPTELDGITFSKWRAESIKGYGNAIVPQVALELFKVIEKINCDLSK